MGCETSKKPRQPKDTNQQVQNHQINKNSNQNQEQYQKIDASMIADKQKYLHEQLDEGRSKPPTVNIPRIPAMH